MKQKSRTITRFVSLLATLTISTITVTGCSEKKKESAAPPTTPPPTTATPPPTFTDAQVKRQLVTAKEIGPGVRDIPVAADVLKNNRVPTCSLSSTRLPGSPETTSRQLENSANGKGEIVYTQVIGLYADTTEASAAYKILLDKAKSCPAKQNVAAKKIRSNFTLFAHKDIWSIKEDKLLEWDHVRGTERQEFSASSTKYNFLHLMYDYAVRGNLVIATLYYERTEPNKSGDPTAKRATDVLTKQLRKFG